MIENKVELFFDERANGLYVEIRDVKRDLAIWTIFDRDGVERLHVYLTTWLDKEDESE